MEEAIKLFGKFDSIDKIIEKISFFDFKSKGPDYREIIKINYFF